MPIKSLKYILAFIIIVFTNPLNAQKNITTILLNIENAPKEAVLITTPLAGQYFAGTQYYDSTDISGQLNIYLDLPQAGFCYLYPQYLHPEQNGWAGIQLYIEPGETYQVNFDMYDATTTITFGGDNVTEHQFIRQLPRKWLPDELKVADWVQEYIEGKSAEQVYQEWSNQRLEELDALQALANKELVTHDFFSAMQDDIAYYHVYLFQKLWAAGIKYQPQQHAEWNAYQEVAIAENPISNPKALHSMWYQIYCEAYRLYYLEQRNAAEINQKYQRIADFFTVQYQTYKDYFSSNIHENILANVIFTEVNNSGSQAPVQEAYRDYQYNFQNSNYLPYLKIFFPHIQAPVYTPPPMVEYSLPEMTSIDEYPTTTTYTTNTTLTDFAAMEGVDMIPNQQDINSLSGLLKGFHGKTLYVDIWASWCGPCKEQFGKKKTLEKYIKGKDIELLYISIDEDKNVSAWQQDIKDYGLKGHHIRANPTLVQEVQERFGQFGILFLPAYGIVNRYGEIVEPAAKKPSDGQALIQQLEQY